MDRTALDIDRLRAALLPRWPRVDVVAETASTNSDLLNTSGAPDRSVLVAENQIGGRGRLDRKVSPPRAGLTVSVLVRPRVPLVRWGWLPLIAGLALSDAVTRSTGVETSLKWPNDLLAAASGRKLAGILAQTNEDAVVIGIGLNVSTTAEELPDRGATSLTLAGAAEVDRTRLLIDILSALDSRLAQWIDTGGDAAACGLAAAYTDRSATMGTHVRVRVGDAQVVAGDAVAVDEVGRLVVRTSEGEQAMTAGDVEQVRPV